MVVGMALIRSIEWERLFGPIATMMISELNARTGFTFFSLEGKRSGGPNEGTVGTDRL